MKPIIGRLLGATIIFSIFIVGCSGGDGGIEGTGGKPVNHTISGTAATGAPIGNSTVRIKGVSGKKVPNTTDSDGKFTLGINDLPGTMLLRAERNGLPHLYSIVASDNTDTRIANIHPYTDVIVRNWFAIQGLDIDGEFDSDNPVSLLPTPEQIAEIQEAIINLIALAMIQFQVPDGFNLISTPFDANQMGFDSFLDFSRVTIDNNLLQIILIDIIDPTRTTTIVSVNIDEDLTVEDATSPSIPQNVRAVPASETEIILLWDAATDNIGVAGYEIFRAGEAEPFATTPYPVYSDTGLTASTEYCYYVDAIDGAGNRSTRAATATCGTTDDPELPPDTTAPAQVEGLNVDSVTESSISLVWTAATEPDLVGYYVNRWNGSTYVNVGNALINSFTDTGLDASTEYCYVIQAYDAVPNVGLESLQACGTTDTIVVPDDTPPVVTATPAGGNFTTQVSVILGCDDNGGSGCAGIYYTVDGNDPTASSTQYTTAIELNATTELRFMAIDNAGNESAPVTETYNINLPPSQQLTVVSNDSNGSVVSDIAGIDCGSTCEASFDINSEVTLTASHSGGLVAIWMGCTSTVLNECTVQVSQDRTVYVSFVAAVDEVNPNETYNVSQSISSASIITGFFDATDDSDYYSIVVSATGTFFASISHPSATSFMTLYDSTNQPIVSTGGCCGAAVHTLTRSLTPGTYYLQVRSDNVQDLVTPYTLAMYGTVLNTPSPDAHEENDSFATAVPVTTSGTLQGYLDTSNDVDFFSFEVTTRSTFFVTISHPNSTSFMTLYDSTFTAVVNSGGCCGASTHTITRSLDPGTYYLQVRSDNVSNLVDPYSLTFSGTTFGDPSPDTYEQNDFFATAAPVTSSGILQAYLDTANDEDFYTFEVTTRSTFYVTISHPSATSFMTLYDSAFTALVNSGGCCGAATHTITRSLDPGTYYVQVRSDNVSDLSTPYSLAFSGTTFGDPTPDTFEQNDFFATATPVTSSGTLQAYLDTANDEDFYRFEVTDRSTFFVTISHPSATSFMTLYDSTFTALVNSGGCCGAATHTITRSLDPGIYYVQVRSDNVSDLSVPYMLNFSGTSFGDPTPDTYEENDSFTSATPVASSGTLQAYLDTANDEDFYTFEVTDRSTFLVSISHPTAPSFMTLYDSSFTALVNSGGCCGATSHTITRSLDPGIYYLQVRSDNVSELSVSYSLAFSGTAFGDLSPDANEENDSAATATPITDNADYQGYFDTANDADYYVIEVTVAGTLEVNVNHVSATSFVTLFDSSETPLINSGGCCGSATHSVSYSVTTGTYYVRVLSDNVSDLATPYTLSLPAIQ